MKAPYMLYNRTKSSDMRFEPVTDSRGRKVPVSFATYEVMLEKSPDTTLRRNAFLSFTRGISAYQNVLGGTFGTEIRKNVVLAKARGFESATHMFLHRQESSLKAYTNLLDIIQKEIAPHMRRYVEFRKEVLGLDKIMYCDIEAPLDPEFDPETTFEEAGKEIGAATLNDELTKELFDTFFPEPEAEETVHFGEGPDVSVPSLPAGDPQDLAGAYRMIRDPITTAEKAISLLTQIRVTAQGDEAVALVFPIGSGMPHTIWVAERPGVYRDTASGALMVFDEWQTLFGRNRPSRMYIDLWAFDRLKFYETTSFATVCLGIIIAVFVWPVLAWVFRRKASGLAVLLGLVDVVAVTGIAGSLLTAPDWEITTRVPNTTKAALALPLVGTALAVALAWQTLTKTVDSKKPCRRPFNLRTRQGFASRVLPWLCVVAHAGLVWFLNIWNLLGWKF
jgi:hypothetical protein